MRRPLRVVCLTGELPLAMWHFGANFQQVHLK